jgi:hypothetical protein
MWKINIQNRFTFVATGTEKISLTCADGSKPSCTGEPRLIRGSLLQPFPITPAYGGPTGTSDPRCQALNEKPAWKIVEVGYTNETQMRMQPFASLTPAALSLTLSIINTLNNIKVTCLLIYFSMDVWVVPPPPAAGLCWEYPYSSFYDPRGTPGIIYTDFSYDFKNQLASITQTWWCEEPGSLTP